MGILTWILGSTFAVSLIAWIGLLTLSLNEKILKKILLVLVAFSAGTLIGGAFLHLIPKSVSVLGSSMEVFATIIIGFSLFFLLEQFLHWHHCHRTPSSHKKPVSYLILLADALHNFIDGLTLSASFLVSVPTGIATWTAIVAHEVPQELGDFGILLHSGWKKLNALIYNFLSALTIVVGGLFAFFISKSFNVVFLLPFAAGNFIYIASSDLIPEVKHEDIKKGLAYFLAFIVGVLLLLFIKVTLN